MCDSPKMMDVEEIAAVLRDPLSIYTFASHTVTARGTDLHVTNEERPYKMAHSSATGDVGADMESQEIGADIIRLNGGDGFVPHTHPGNHVLCVLSGRGTIAYNGVVVPTFPGQVYIVEGGKPHGVSAIDDHVILAIGAPHKPVDSADRMVPVAYETVLSPMGTVYCMVCKLGVHLPTRLHDMNCSHCPCPDCLPDSGNSPEVRYQKQKQHERAIRA